MTLTPLHDGIHVPEYAARVPWLITEPDLPGCVPGAAFGTSPGGGWPLLRFTLLGVDEVHAFNFVTHPEGRLVEVQTGLPAGPDADDIFRANAAALRERLGDPNRVDMPDHYHLMWDDARVRVNYSAARPDDPTGVRTHSLSVFFHAGVPRAWVPPADRNLGAVVGLLNRLPGAEVAVVRRRPDRLTLGLTVLAPGSVSRLAQMTEAANVPLRVEVNAYRVLHEGLGRADPTGVLYSLEAPAPWEPETDESPTVLQILGLYLVGHLVEEGRMGEAEAHRLELAFNNHEPLDYNSET